MFEQTKTSMKNDLTLFYTLRQVVSTFETIFINPKMRKGVCLGIRYASFYDRPQIDCKYIDAKTFLTIFVRTKK